MISHGRSVVRHPADGRLVLRFAAAPAFEDWLDAHAGDEPGLWVQFAKKGRGIASITLPQALEVSTCFGWVDSKMHRLDDDFYLLRYQPRGRRSTCSPRNRALAERLHAEGRMRPCGLAQMHAAKVDGRWPT